MLVAEAAEFFLNAAYEEHLLEEEPESSPRIPFHAFDCYTLMEQCVAIALILNNYQRTWPDYVQLITQLRYRDGIIGYASRLHYFRDWLQHHIAKGRVRDVTPSLGGIPYEKSLFYMTSHVTQYPQLHDRALWEQIRDRELALSHDIGYYLPTDRISAAVPALRAGDLIALTTDTEGLDVMHLAILSRDEEDQPYLIHASREAGQVIRSSVPLERYVAQVEHASGVMVARVV